MSEAAFKRTGCAEDVPNKIAVLLTLSIVDLSVRVLLNVASAMGSLSPFEEKHPLPRRPKSRNTNSPMPVSQDLSVCATKWNSLKGICKSGRRSVHSRPIHLDSFSTLPDEESSSSDGESVSFDDEVKERGYSYAKVLEAMEEQRLDPSLTKSSSISFNPKLTSSSSLRTVPEHALLKGFVRTSTEENPDPPLITRHSRHLSLDDRRCVPDLSDWNVEGWCPNPPSPFEQPLNTSPSDERSGSESVERIESLITIQESDEYKIKADIGSDSEPAKSKLKNHELKTDIKIEEDYNDSPCSSPTSVFSDSAAKFVHSNFCNPDFYEEPIEMEVQPGYGGSMRQRYTLKRLQSLMSHRSLMSQRSLVSQRSRITVQSSNEDSVRMGYPPRGPLDSMRSFRGRSFRGVSSFRSRGDEEGHPILSDAYRMVRLESCIRKAWKMSMDDAYGTGGETVRENEDSKSAAMNSFRKKSSRRFDRARRISFVKVPADFSEEMLMSQKQMLLNPAYGEEDDGQEDDDEWEQSDMDGETILDTSSVAMRTPLRRLGSSKPVYERCEKNLEEGAYNNPLRLCSFRSYDSDTELELTSVRARNPISRLLSLRVSRGITKDGIALAEIDADEYGSLFFSQVNQNPIRNGMLDKYLTQLVIDDTLDAKKVGDACDPEEDDVQWSTCQSEWVPQELDDKLKCFLMDRFLLDNVLNEMDVNLGALELARVKQKAAAAVSRPRKLRRS